MNLLINSMGGILSQCIFTLNYHFVHFKYLTILFLNYFSIKLKRKKGWRKERKQKKEGNIL